MFHIGMNPLKWGLMYTALWQRSDRSWFRLNLRELETKSRVPFNSVPFTNFKAPKLLSFQLLRTMKPEIAEQVARQRPFFEPVLVDSIEGVEFKEQEMGGVDVEVTVPTAGITDKTLACIWTHGGGLSGGLAAWTRRVTARMAKKLGCLVVAPEYRWDFGPHLV